MLPRVIINNGVSLDGRMDGYTAGIDLYYKMAGSWEVEAILSGSSTILVAFQHAEMDGDVPTGPEGGTNGGNGDWPEAGQLLAVVDSRGRIRNWRLSGGNPTGATQWRSAPVLRRRGTWII
jgi:hypothetical protein